MFHGFFHQLLQSRISPRFSRKEFPAEGFSVFFWRLEEKLGFAFLVCFTDCSMVSHHFAAPFGRIFVGTFSKHRTNQSLKKGIFDWCHWNVCFFDPQNGFFFWSNFHDFFFRGNLRPSLDVAAAGFVSGIVSLVMWVGIEAWNMDVSKNRETPQNGWWKSWKTLFFDGWFGGKTHYFWKHPHTYFKWSTASSS